MVSRLKLYYFSLLNVSVLVTIKFSLFTKKKIVCNMYGFSYKNCTFAF